MKILIPPDKMWTRHRWGSRWVETAYGTVRCECASRRRLWLLLTGR